jgi:glycosyltransferase involved in cell wall biosynthesis
LLVQDYGVSEKLITVARPGTERVPVAPVRDDGVVRLLSIGALVHRKGFDVLIAALATLADLPWRLTIAGDRTRNPEVAARVDADIAKHKLGERVQVLGAVSDGRIEALYAEADVFALASRFEGYGMAYAEALARGLPVVGTTGGATSETVPASAGILVAPDDVVALAAALRRLISNKAERERMADAARTAAAALPTWQDSAKIFAATIEAAA